MAQPRRSGGGGGGGSRNRHPNPAPLPAPAGEPENNNNSNNNTMASFCGGRNPQHHRPAGAAEAVAAASCSGSSASANGRPPPPSCAATAGHSNLRRGLRRQKRRSCCGRSRASTAGRQGNMMAGSPGATALLLLLVVLLLGGSGFDVHHNRGRGLILSVSAQQQQQEPETAAAAEGGGGGGGTATTTTDGNQHHSFNKYIDGRNNNYNDNSSNSGGGSPSSGTAAEAPASEGAAATDSAEGGSVSPLAATSAENSSSNNNNNNNTSGSNDSNISANVTSGSETTTTTPPSSTTAPPSSSSIPSSSVSATPGPTAAPTPEPTTAAPTSSVPTTPAPTQAPSSAPSLAPTSLPSDAPSSMPTPSCHDDASYRSPINSFGCADHRGTNCISWRFLGLSIADVEKLIGSCPISCSVECGTYGAVDVKLNFLVRDLRTFLSPESDDTMERVGVEYLTRFCRDNQGAGDGNGGDQQQLMLHPDSQFFLYEAELLSQEIVRRYDPTQEQEQEDQQQQFSSPSSPAGGGSARGRIRRLQQRAPNLLRSLQSSVGDSTGGGTSSSGLKEKEEEDRERVDMQVSVAFRGYAINTTAEQARDCLVKGLVSDGYTLAIQRSGDDELVDAWVSTARVEDDGSGGDGSGGAGGLTGGSGGDMSGMFSEAGGKHSGGVVHPDTGVSAGVIVAIALVCVLIVAALGFFIWHVHTKQFPMPPPDAVPIEGSRGGGTIYASELYATVLGGVNTSDNHNHNKDGHGEFLHSPSGDSNRSPPVLSNILSFEGIRPRRSRDGATSPNSASNTGSSEPTTDEANSPRNRGLASNPSNGSGGVDSNNGATESSGTTRTETEDDEEEEHPYAGIIPPMIVIDHIDEYGTEDMDRQQHQQGGESGGGCGEHFEAPFNPLFSGNQERDSRRESHKRNNSNRSRGVKNVVPSKRVTAPANFVAALNNSSPSCNAVGAYSFVTMSDVFFGNDDDAIADFMIQQARADAASHQNRGSAMGSAGDGGDTTPTNNSSATPTARNTSGSAGAGATATQQRQQRQQQQQQQQQIENSQQRPLLPVPIIPEPGRHQISPLHLHEASSLTSLDMEEYGGHGHRYHSDSIELRMALSDSAVGDFPNRSPNAMGGNDEMMSSMGVESPKSRQSRYSQQSRVSLGSRISPGSSSWDSPGNYNNSGNSDNNDERNRDTLSPSPHNLNEESIADMNVIDPLELHYSDDAPPPQQQQQEQPSSPPPIRSSSEGYIQKNSNVVPPQYNTGTVDSAYSASALSTMTAPPLMAAAFPASSAPLGLPPSSDGSGTVPAAPAAKEASGSRSFFGAFLNGSPARRGKRPSPSPVARAAVSEAEGASAGASQWSEPQGTMRRAAPLHIRHGSRSSTSSSDYEMTEGEVQLVFQAPRKGKLGLVIQVADGFGPVVVYVKDYSPLLGQVHPGDRLVNVDGVKTTAMSLSEVTGLLSGRQLTRWASTIRLVVVRTRMCDVNPFDAAVTAAGGAGAGFSSGSGTMGSSSGSSNPYGSGGAGGRVGGGSGSEQASIDSNSLRRELSGDSIGNIPQNGESNWPYAP